MGKVDVANTIVTDLAGLNSAIQAANASGAAETITINTATLTLSADIAPISPAPAGRC